MSIFLVCLTIKITCCIQREEYARQWTFFSKINFALEELRQVDFARYNKKSKAPLLLIALIFFSLFNSVTVVCIYFLRAQLGKHQSSALALSDLLLLLTSVLSFSTIFVHRVQLKCIQIKLASQ